jgi:hypothetical protein
MSKDVAPQRVRREVVTLENFNAMDEAVRDEAPFRSEQG